MARLHASLRSHETHVTRGLPEVKKQSQRVAKGFELRRRVTLARRSVSLRHVPPTREDDMHDRWEAVFVFLPAFCQAFKPVSGLASAV